MAAKKAIKSIAQCAIALVAFSLGWATSASALCILDNCADQKPPRSSDGDRRDGDFRNRDFSHRGFRRNGSGPRGASIPGQFDYYVLSLSWSPGFCATGGDEKGRDQCRAGADIGFIVHGLWPQYERGYPSDCDGSRSLSRRALAVTDGVYPDEGLARYEWRKHGICSGLAPVAYFTAAKNARDAVTIPALFKDPHQTRSLSPADVERAFMDANPKLHPGMLAAICMDGTLDEVRFCFSKDLASFRPCPEVVGEGCRSHAMTVPPVR